MGVSAGPELPDFDDPAVDPGVEEAQGRQWDDPGHEEDCPVEIVGHVVLVVPDQIRPLSGKHRLMGWAMAGQSMSYRLGGRELIVYHCYSAVSLH